MIPKVPHVTARSARLERERLTSLINSMGDGVIAINQHGKIVLYNGAALNTLDVNSSITGKKITDVIHLIDKDNQPVDLLETIRGSRTSFSTRDWRLKYSDGSSINLYTSIAPVRLGYRQKGVHGFVVLIRDITREKSLEEERDEFISVVSHELRTPIAIAEGNVSNAEFIFEKSGINHPTIRESLRQAHEQITFLAGMMNDLATLSRAERGKLTLELESVNAHTLVEDLAHSYANDADAKGLEIKIDLDSHLELLQTSNLYLREVLQNFITNAIKYTEEGHVTIGAKQKKGGIEFYVEDTGIGISKTDQERVYDKFFRSEDYRTRANSGTGLGLYVTLKLARLIHAELSLKSEINKGSTFTVFVPNLK
jgi:two-component system, OmpR family, phosphate regulon sensor histidine kinase PhoR